MYANRKWCPIRTRLRPDRKRPSLCRRHSSKLRELYRYDLVGGVGAGRALNANKRNKRGCGEGGGDIGGGDVGCGGDGGDVGSSGCAGGGGDGSGDGGDDGGGDLDIGTGNKFMN